MSGFLPAQCVGGEGPGRWLGWKEVNDAFGHGRRHQRDEREYDMTEPTEGQRDAGPSETARQANLEGAGRSPVATESTAGGSPSSATEPVGTAASGAPGPDQEQGSGPSKALLGPFTLRELVFGGGVALVFIGTLLPFVDGIVRYINFWNSVPLFFVGIGILLPVIALALLAGRRLGGTGLRVGSLSVDQFASVSAVLAATFFFLQTATDFHAGPMVALIGSLGMVAATVVGPFLPIIKDDFAGRPEVPAHRLARPIAAARPRPPKPPKPAEASTIPGAVGPRSGHPGQAGVNPAAAAVLQNGAGLYGAGGAGAVGAGAAASGQSGLAATGGRQAGQGLDGAPAGVHAFGKDVDQDVDRESAHDETGEGRDHPVAAGTPEARSSQSPSNDQTRLQDVAADDSTRTYATVGHSEDRGRQEPITATRSAEEEPVVEAFWFAVGSPRPVFDEQAGREVFALQPGDWEVGIEDRGSEFLVQDKRTGAVGILRDLRNIERAPRD